MKGFIRNNTDWISLILSSGLVIVLAAALGDYLNINQSIEKPVMAQRMLSATQVTEIVENNVFLFTPGFDGETTDEVQLDRTLSQLGEKYRITSLVIRDQKNPFDNHTVIGINNALIIVGPK